MDPLPEPGLQGADGGFENGSGGEESSVRPTHQ